MEINETRLKRVAGTAKAKTDSKRWHAAIDKAVEGLLGTWIVTELAHGIMVTTENGTYYANGACQCKSYEFGQACKHRAAARLVAMMSEEAEAAPVASPAPKWNERDAAPIVRPEPRGVQVNGWSI